MKAFKKAPLTVAETPRQPKHKGGKSANQAALPYDFTEDIELITPEMAARYLTKSRLNRSMSLGVVESYAADMRSGKWKLTLDPIRFNEAGELMDGQHRLSACVMSGCAFLTKVVHGVPDEMMKVLDTGRRRKVSDHLAIRGISQPVVRAAAARWLLFFKSGSKSRTSYNLRPSNSEVEDLIDRHPNLEASCIIADHPLGIPGSLLVAIHYVGAFLLDKKGRADAFATTFVKGVSNREFYQEAASDPAVRWRERLLRLRDTEKKTLFASTVYAGTVHVWNAYSIGKELKIITPPQTVTFNGLDVGKI